MRLFLLISTLMCVYGFVPTPNRNVIVVTGTTLHLPYHGASHNTRLFAKSDLSKSGNKRERLDKLAELEELREETDNSAVFIGAGAFVGLLVILGIVAVTSGVLDPAIQSGDVYSVN